MKKISLIFALLCFSFQLIATSSEEGVLCEFQSVTFLGEDAEITLNDGYTLKWVFTNQEKKMLDRWRKGDRVFVTYSPHEMSARNKVILLNPDSDVLYFPQTLPTDSTLVRLPVVHSIEADQEKAVITLDNGGSWKTEDVEELEHWSEGDSVWLTRFGEGGLQMGNMTLMPSAEEECFLVEVEKVE